MTNAAAGGVLSQGQIEQWREQGYCLADELLPGALLRELAEAAAAAFPAPGSDAAAGIVQFGSEQRLVFPSRVSAVNDVTLHPNLLAAVAALLDVPVSEVRLTQSDVWPKYGRAQTGTSEQDNADQRVHCDYPNHMLVHPPPWDRPESVEIIIYYSDFQECGGATAVVPRRGQDDPAYQWPIVRTPGVAGVPYINDRGRAEDFLAQRHPETADFRAHHLYAREVLAEYRFGSVLFYRHDTWHRGTPLREGALRIVQNLTYRKASAEWVNVLHPGWSWSMYRPDQFMERLVAESSVEQRAVMGFPPPGSSYWCAETIDAVQARYAAWGIDMSPYRAALA